MTMSDTSCMGWEVDSLEGYDLISGEKILLESVYFYSNQFIIISKKNGKPEFVSLSFF